MVAANYLTDASGFTGWAERVIVPQSEEEVVAALREAVESRTPVTIAGAGSGLTGARVPQGGWVLSLEKFRRLEIERGVAHVGAAVSLLALRDAAAAAGQFYPPDPTEITASMGGTIATNASGSRSFKFGSTRRYVRALRVARMDGSVRWYKRGERRVNLIVYMQPGWKEEWGGSLGLWATDTDGRTPGELIQQIPCLFNRAVIFDTSQNSWHGLPEPVKSPEGICRNSMATYYLCQPRAEASERGRALFAPHGEQARDESVLELIRKRSGVDTSASVYRSK